MSSTEENRNLTASPDICPDEIDRIIEQTTSLINSIYDDLNANHSVVTNLRNSQNNLQPNVPTSVISNSQVSPIASRIGQDARQESPPTFNLCETFEDNSSNIDLLPSDVIIGGSANLINPRRTTSNRSPEIIDLVNVETPVIGYSRHNPVPTNDIIDLCTPPNRRISASARRLNVSRGPLYNNNDDHNYSFIIEETSNTSTDILPEASATEATNRISLAFAQFNDDDLDVVDPNPAKILRKSPNTIAKDKCDTNTSASDEDSYKCPVCFEKIISRKPTTTKCGHVFCNKCIIMALQETHKCPICNAKLNKNQVFRIYL